MTCPLFLLLGGGKLQFEAIVPLCRFPRFAYVCPGQQTYSTIRSFIRNLRLITQCAREPAEGGKGGKGPRDSTEGGKGGKGSRDRPSVYVARLPADATDEELMEVCHPCLALYLKFPPPASEVVLAQSFFQRVLYLTHKHEKTVGSGHAPNIHLPTEMVVQSFFSPHIIFFLCSYPSFGSLTFSPETGRSLHANWGTLDVNGKVNAKVRGTSGKGETCQGKGGSCQQGG